MTQTKEPKTSINFQLTTKLHFKNINLKIRQIYQILRHMGVPGYIWHTCMHVYVHVYALSLV